MRPMPRTPAFERALVRAETSGARLHLAPFDDSAAVAAAPVLDRIPCDVAAVRPAGSAELLAESLVQPHRR